MWSHKSFVYRYSYRTWEIVFAVSELVLYISYLGSNYFQMFLKVNRESKNMPNHFLFGISVIKT